MKGYTPSQFSHVNKSTAAAVINQPTQWIFIAVLYSDGRARVHKPERLSLGLQQPFAKLPWTPWKGRRAIVPQTAKKWLCSPNGQCDCSDNPEFNQTKLQHFSLLHNNGPRIIITVSSKWLAKETLQTAWTFHRPAVRQASKLSFTRTHHKQLRREAIVLQLYRYADEPITTSTNRRDLLGKPPHFSPCPPLQHLDCSCSLLVIKAEA